MENKYNILLLSHGITSSTGFGRVIKQIADALKVDGHTIYSPALEYHGKSLHFETANALSGEDYSGINLLGYGAERFGEDIVPFYIQKYDIDIVITLGDIYAYQYLRQVPNYGKWRWLAYYALDTNNLVGFWVDNIKHFDVPVVMSEFGQILCDKHGIKVKHIPHAVDIDVFTPVKDSEEKMRIRQKFNLPPKAFVVGCVAHNQVRKMLDKTFDAFMIFAHSHTDAVLLLHTQPNGMRDGGWDLARMIETYGIADKVYFTNYNSKGVGDAIVGDADMRDLYCAMDVHLLLTGGEGFGIPFIESMACGVPNVTSAYTTGPEIMNGTPVLDGKVPIMGEYGVCVPVDSFYTHPTGGKWAMANVEDAAKALSMLYGDRALYQRMANAARERMVEKYSTVENGAMWRDLVSSVAVSKDREWAPIMPFGAFTLPMMQKIRAGG